MAKNGKKNEKKFILYDDLLDFLSDEKVRENELLQKLYDSIHFDAVVTVYMLEDKEKKAKEMINRLKEKDISKLLGTYLLDKNRLINSVENAFKNRRSLLYQSDTAFSEGYYPWGSNTKSKNNKKTSILDTYDMSDSKQCNYDEFIKAIEEIKNPSAELKELLYLLNTNKLFDPVKANRLNSNIKQYRKSIEEAFNDLSKIDIQKILSSLENITSEKLGFNKSYILNEYSRRLKRILCSPEYLITDKSKKEYKSKTAGFTEEVKKRNETLTITNKYASSTPKAKVLDRTKPYTASQLMGYLSADGQTIIDYIDKHFNTNILSNFFEELKEIDTDDLPRYVERTNKLIEDTVFYSYFPEIKKIIEAVKSNYHLEFSPLKEDKIILEELISDELRYYQQKNIEDKLNSMDKTFLGTSKRISKEPYPQVEDGLKTVFEELHTSNIPHYAFTQGAFNLPFVVRSFKKDLPDDYIKKHITGSSFLAYPANVDISKNDKNEYIVTTNTTSRFRF